MRQGPVYRPVLRLLVAVAAFAVTLAACGGDAGGPGSTADGGPAGSDGGQTTSSTTTDSGQAVSSTTSTTSLPGGEGGMPVPPPLPPVADYENLLGRYADMVLNGGLVPYGSVEHVHYVVECIKSAGFAVEWEQGGLLARPGVEQEPRYREVMAFCEQAAVDSGLVGPLLPPDEEELAARYEAAMWTYDCLQAAGFPVPDPVSPDVYIESDGSGWHPYNAISPGRYAEAERQCPQDPIVVFEILAAEDAG
jgi:hypothetical protein